MEQEFRDLVQNATKDTSKANSEEEFEKLRVKYLGRKKGLFTKLTKKINPLPIHEKKGIGTLITETRTHLENIFKESGKNEANEVRLSIDPTLPGRQVKTGTLHPITLVLEEVKNVFHYLGFDIADGPEIESDIYNFQKLNIPKDHPSRDLQQTYYLENDLVLRTHTSNMQVRYMEKNKPPIKVIFPGRVYRREMPDATHYPTFFQIEGLQIGSSVKMTDLLGTLDYFAKSLFGQKSKIRVYGHHFPYTEPSIEVEVFHPKKGWLEILGAGMVHPKVLKEGGLDPDKYQGWAFGVGAERIAMLKYEIDDIRLLYENDLRVLNQF